MTSKVSNNNTKAARFSPLLHYWKCGVRSNIRLQVILTVLHLVAAPAVILSIIIGVYTGSRDADTYTEIYFSIGCLTTAIAGVMGISAAVTSFSCLHKRSVVDMRFSLPLTSVQRFICNYLSGLFSYLAPFFSAQIISLLMCLYGLIFMDGKTFSYVDYTGIAVGKYVCDYFGDITPVLLKLIAAGTLVMLMLYTISVFISVCCGSRVEAVVYTLLINAVIPATIILTLYSMFDDLYGVDSGAVAEKLTVFTSPAGGIYAAATWAMNEGDISEDFNYGVWAAVYFLITAAIGAFALFLYKKRRAEQVSKPFVFKAAYYIIITGTIFCIYSLFYICDIRIVPMIIVTAVCYMIFEVAVNRGFKRFWLSIIKYIATVSAAVIIVFVGQKSEGLGAVQRVPSAWTVAYAEITYSGFYGDFPLASYYSGNGITIREPENIQIIIDAHNALIENYKKNKDNNFQDSRSYNSYWTYSNGLTVDSGIGIRYKLKNGSTIVRSYNMFTVETANILGQLDLTDEYKTRIAERYKETVLSIPKNIESQIYDTPDVSYNINYITGNNDYAYVITHNIITRSTLGKSYNYSEQTMYSLYRRGFFEQLADAYYKDIMAINEENYYRSKLKNQYELHLEGSGMGSIRIPESFRNTLELLEYFEFDIERLEELSDGEIYAALSKAMSFSGVGLLSESEYREIMQAPCDQPLYIMYSYYGSDIRRYAAVSERIYLYNIDRNLCNLIRAAEPRNIIGENCYTITVSSFSGAIPAEMRSTAEIVAEERTSYDQAAEQAHANIAAKSAWD